MISEITVDGNLAADPQTRTFQNGNSIITARIGHALGHYDRQTRKWVDQGTMWLSIQARSNDPTLTGARKGDHLLVTGRLTQRFWQDNNGQDRSDLQIRVQQAAIIPRQQHTNNPPASNAWQRGQTYSERPQGSSDPGFDGGF